MSNALKISGPIGLAKLSSPPANPEEGYIYFDTSLGKAQIYSGGSWTDAGGSPEFLSDAFRVKDSSDDTKQFAVDVSRVSSGQTRSLSMPDRDLDLDNYLPVAGVQAASTGNVASLEDAPFVTDGYTVNDGDLVLIKDQNDPKENGVYIVQAGPWERIFRLKDGDIITVQNGNKHRKESFKCYTDFPVPNFGTSNIFFDCIARDPDKVFGQPGAHVFVKNENITLSGLQTLDGYNLQDGDIALLNGQTDPTENGIWQVHSGAWTRQTDTYQGHLIQVFEGIKYRGNLYRVFSNGDRNINFGVDEIGFSEVSLSVEKSLGAPSARVFLDSDLATLSGEQTLDGVPVFDGDPVLLGGQNDQTENGIWTVRAGAWERNTNYHRGNVLQIGNGTYQGYSFIIYSDGDSLINFGTDQIFVSMLANNADSTDNAINALVNLSGVNRNDSNLGAFSGNIISDNNSVKGALQELEDAIENLPNPITYNGTWNASTNSPTLADGSGDIGDLYQVSVAGSQDLGSGSISFDVNDKVVYNGSTWEKWDQTDSVSSVNGQSGAVVLALDNLNDVDAATPNDGDVLTYDSGSGTWQAQPSGSSNTFADDVFRIQDNGNATKQLAFEVSGISSSTTRTITVGDENINVSTGTSSSFSNRTLSNLGTTSINADLMPSANDVRQIGSATSRWANMYLFASHYHNASSTEVGSVDAASGLRLSGLNGNNVNIITNANGAGNINLTTGNSNNSTGSITRTTGNSASSGDSGNITDKTGSVASGTRGSHISDAQSFRRQKAANNYVEEEYIHSISLSASQTNTVISELTFDYSVVDAVEITYRLKEATSNDVRVATLRVVCNGTSISYNNASVDTNTIPISFDAVINGSNVNIRYTSGSNTAVMRADIKKFLA